MDFFWSYFNEKVEQYSCNKWLSLTWKVNEKQHILSFHIQYRLFFCFFLRTHRFLTTNNKISLLTDNSPGGGGGGGGGGQFSFTCHWNMWSRTCIIVDPPCSGTVNVLAQLNLCSWAGSTFYFFILNFSTWSSSRLDDPGAAWRRTAGFKMFTRLTAALTESSHV